MKNIRVLFVDDEKSVLSSLERYLIADPFQKLFATNAKEGLRLISQQPVHVVVSDMKMPGTDGLTFLREVRQKNPEIVRMVLSGFSEITQIIPCINTGEIFRYVTKPVEPLEFKKVLYDAIEFYLMKRDKQDLVNRLAKSYVKLKKISKTYRELSWQDDLTGLYNIRYLYQDLEKRFQSDISRLALVFLDVDNFRQVVDVHGHINASKVLKDIGTMILKKIYPPCYGVAFGGDLFILVLPGFDRALALDQIQKIKDGIAKIPCFFKKEGDVKLSVTSGLAVHPDDGHSTNALLSNADCDLSGNKEKRKTESFF